MDSTACCFERLDGLHAAQHTGTVGEWDSRSWYPPSLTPGHLLNLAHWLTLVPGKTVIASLIIEEMKNVDSVYVGFFYCKYSDNQKNTFTDVLRSILVQLVQQNEDLLSYVYDACCSTSEFMMDSQKLLKDLVETSLRSCPNTCIVIDGIDECGETEEKKIIAWFLATCEKVTKDNGETIRLLFVSQRDKVAENLLAQAAVISLDSKYHQEDIQKYARHWSSKIQRKFELPGSSASQIGTVVAARAKGEQKANYINGSYHLATFDLTAPFRVVSFRQISSCSST